MKGLIKNNITLAKRFNFTMRYIDDVLTLNNSRFVTEIRHIYPSELDLKRTTENSTSLSYLDLLTKGNIQLMCMTRGMTLDLTLLTFPIFVVTSPLSKLMGYIFPSL